MPEVPPAERCDTSASADGKHLCGINCRSRSAPTPAGVPDVAALSPQCDGFISPLSPCSKTEVACALQCKGKWVAAG